MEEKIICGNEEMSGLPEYVFEAGDYPVPDCYLQAKYMVPIARLMKEHEEKSLCTVPFCQTAEVEMLHGAINNATDGGGPRVGQQAYKKLEELPMEEPFYVDGLFGETKKALKELKEAGEKTMLIMSGPISILSGLVPLQKLFVARRKNPALYEKAIAWVTEALLFYLDEVYPYVDILSYADSAGSVGLLGEPVAVEMTEKSHRLVLEKAMKYGMHVHLCPRLNKSLLLGGFADHEKIPVDESLTYEEAILSGPADVLYAQRCIKQSGKGWNKGYIMVLKPTWR
ncbi:MAG: hypothetical protein E7277_10095 [Lachnospiraceae bacterium]|nr:hypothetical protein [Lachnospiraceae bacterium]